MYFSKTCLFGLFIFYFFVSKENTMKRIIYFVTFTLCSLSFGQDLTSKKGETILPQEGDWCIGMSAHPLSNFIFNLFSDSPTRDDNMPSFGDPLYFSMKRFVRDDKALRYTVGANFNTKEETWSMGLGYGVEYRKGNTRLQGMWGYSGFIGIGENFDSSDWLSIPNMILEDGYNMNINTSLFIGCEYFVFAKIAIGAEYTYGLTMNVTDNKTNFYIGNNANSTIMKINYYF